MSHWKQKKMSKIKGLRSIWIFSWITGERCGSLSVHTVWKR